MKSYYHIEAIKEGHKATIWLSRPEKRNALNAQMTVELIDILNLLASDKQTDQVVLRGRGEVFCAGADLNWMENNILPQEERPEHLLPWLLKKLFYFPKPLIAIVHGSAMGGALGMIACADFVLAEENSKFAFSEVRLGLIPATIAPFVVRRIGEFNARRLMILGSVFDTIQVRKAGLVDIISSKENLDKDIENLCNDLGKNAPQAMQQCKHLLQHIVENDFNDNLFDYCADKLMEIRESDEALEGIAAFKEKRKAVWRRQ